MRRPTEVALRLGLPLGLVAFWSGLVSAAHAYPGGYDWQYQAISVLLHSDENPSGYLWAWAGLELCGLFGVAWVANLRRRIRRLDPTASARGLRWLQLGFVCMCCAVVPNRLLMVPKGHETIVLVAFVTLCLGMVQGLFLAGVGLAERLRERHARTAATRLPLWLPAIPFVPLLAVAVTQLYLALARPTLPWVNPGWRALGVSLYLSFAVWEWLTCALYSACLLLLWRADLRLRPRAPLAG